MSAYPHPRADLLPRLPLSLQARYFGPDLEWFSARFASRIADALAGRTAAAASLRFHTRTSHFVARTYSIIPPTTFLHLTAFLAYLSRRELRLLRKSSSGQTGSASLTTDEHHAGVIGPLQAILGLTKPRSTLSEAGSRK